MKYKSIYSDDYAMTYEYLIRRAHQCGRFDIAGADADMYRKFMRTTSIYLTEKEAIKNNKPRKWKMSEENMLKEYMLSMGEVSAYLKTSISLVLKNYTDEFTNIHSEELHKALSLLSNYNIEDITKSMEIAEKIMVENGIFPK